MNETIANILSRLSVRSYAPGAIPPETMELILKAGMAAPSACDRRPWTFVTVTEPATLRALGDALPTARMTGGATAAIVVCGDMERRIGEGRPNLWVQDCSAVTENILLAAHSLGLGAVWDAVYPYEDRIEPVRRILGLPDHIIPLSLVPMGIPAGEGIPKDKWEPTRIHRERW